MSIRTIRLVGGKLDETATVAQFDAEGGCRLLCRFRGKELTAIADDFFEALCLIRLQLEKEGLGLLCYGSSLNVYPSRMAREMGAGLKAYKMTMGRRTSMSDLVDIFSDGSDVSPATVSEQREFLEQWVASIRK